MSSYRIAVKIAAALLLVGMSAVIPAVAQTNSAPVVVKQTTAKATWLKGEVVHADGHSIIVRERGNERALHTFTYSSNLQGSMQALSDAGGYQYGDKVKILYRPGQTVALKIKGKRSQ